MNSRQGLKAHSNCKNSIFATITLKYTTDDFFFQLLETLQGGMTVNQMHTP